MVRVLTKHTTENWCFVGKRTTEKNTINRIQHHKAEIIEWLEAKEIIDFPWWLTKICQKNNKEKQRSANRSFVKHCTSLHSRNSW